MAGRKKRKKRRAGRKIPILITIVIVLLLLFLTVVLRDRYFQREVSFPYTTDDGCLMITSLIQFDGPNADGDGLEGEDIAGIQVENISGQYIEEADVELIMENGDSYDFLIQDLPAEMTATAFERSSGTYDGETACDAVRSSAAAGDISMGEGAFDISTEGTEIVVTNISEEPTGEMTVIYHLLAGDSYIGGRSYEIQIPPLEPGETFEYEDTAGLLGIPQTVGIKYNE